MFFFFIKIQQGSHLQWLLWIIQSYHSVSFSSSSMPCPLFFFFFLLVYVCVHVWTCMIVRECIRISSPGTCDQPNPPKILSNATIFVQPAQHVPCVAHQTSLMAETLKLDFQRQLQQHSLLLLFWGFSVLFLWGKCVANWYGYRKWQMETKGSCLTYQTT